MSDNRMRWILNLEEIEKRPWHWMEYEIASEGFINGLFQHGNGSILCGALDFNPDQTGLYRYLLKIKTAEWEQSEDTNRKGYAFRDGIVGELLSLFSIYFRRRFYLVSSYYGDLTENSLRVRTIIPFLHVPCHPSLHPQVFSKDQENWSGGISPFLESVKSLDAQYHLHLMLAVNHYARALKEIGIDPEMVFIRLVSSIEALSSFSVVLNTNEDPLVEIDFDSLMKDLSNKQKEVLGTVLKNRKAQLKFIKFVEDYLEGYSKFPAEGGHTQVGLRDLKKRLKAIYKARSDYLHSGLPMYLSRPSAAFPEWDMEPSKGQVIDRRKFLESQKLPNVWWFDGIVRYCLLRFLETHQLISKTAIIINNKKDFENLKDLIKCPRSISLKRIFRFCKNA